MNVSFNMTITNIDRIHDKALSNQIWSQLLWVDLHLVVNRDTVPHIFFTVLWLMKYNLMIINIMTITNILLIHS